MKKNLLKSYIKQQAEWGNGDATGIWIYLNIWLMILIIVPAVLLDKYGLIGIITGIKNFVVNSTKYIIEWIVESFTDYTATSIVITVIIITTIMVFKKMGELDKKRRDREEYIENNYCRRCHKEIKGESVIVNKSNGLEYPLCSHCYENFKNKKFSENDLNGALAMVRIINEKEGVGNE